MEVLFSTQLASYEAWILILCIFAFIGIYVFNGIAFIQRVYIALRPAKPNIGNNQWSSDVTINEVSSPILEPIAQEEVDAHEAEKIKAEEEHVQEVINSEVFEEKILEEIQNADSERNIEKINIDTAEDRELVIESNEDLIENIDLHVVIDSKDWTKEEPNETSNDPIVDSTLIAETTSKLELDTTNETEISIENDIEEKERIEEELLNPSIQEPLEINIEKNEELSINEQSQFEDDQVKKEEEEESVSELAITEPIIDSEEWDKSIIQQDIFEEVSLIDSETTDIQEQVELVDSIWNSNQVDTEVNTNISNTIIDEDFTIGSESVTIDTESPILPITASIPEVTPEVRKSSESQYAERLYSITNEVKTLIARWYNQDARALIIQWLALDKNHRELNLILGSIYESERQAQKAEYIYKDLALMYPEDWEILERLANILIIEKRYELALEIYKKIITITGETEWSLYIMTHLAHELHHDEELYAYARRYQKNWPNNPDILTLLAEAEIAIGERQSAIQTLIKLKNLTPYNNEIMETIAKLKMEEELAGNFGAEKL